MTDNELEKEFDNLNEELVNRKKHDPSIVYMIQKRFKLSECEKVKDALGKCFMDDNSFAVNFTGKYKDSGYHNGEIYGCSVDMYND